MPAVMRPSLKTLLFPDRILLRVIISVYYTIIFRYLAGILKANIDRHRAVRCRNKFICLVHILKIRDATDPMYVHAARRHTCGYYKVLDRQTAKRQSEPPEEE